MAMSILEVGFNITTGGAIAYTVPAGKYLEVTLLQICNSQASVIDLTAQITANAGITNYGFLTSTSPVAAKDSVSVAAGLLLLPSGREVKLTGSANGLQGLLCGYLKDNPA